MNLALIKIRARFISRCTFDYHKAVFPEGCIYRVWLPWLLIKVTRYASMKDKAETRRKAERIMSYWGLK